MTPTTNLTKLEPRTWSEQELLARMLDRHGDAWREFHRRYDRLVFRCIHKVTARFRSVIAEDDVQEVYAMFLLNLTARNMHKLRCFDPERGHKLSSWIGLLATNTAWDHLRGVARRPSCAELAEVESAGADTPDPHHRLLERERLRLVTDALKEFSDKDQYFVRLYYMDEREPEEIASLMKISVKTVYSKKHKIRCRLEQALGGSAAAAAA